MFYAILASLMTYFYLQWPTLLSLLSIITWSSVVFFVCYTILVYLIMVDDDIVQKQFNLQKTRGLVTDFKEFKTKWDEDVAKSTKRARVWCRIAIVMVLLNFSAPDQKTLGTTVAVGASTYLAYEAITSETMQKFLHLVKLQANTFMDEQIKELTTVK